MDWKLVAQTVFVGCLLVQIWEDLRWQLLYDEVSLLLAGTGLACAWQRGQFLDAAAASALAGGFLWLLYFFTEGGMGLGDVFLALALGWWLNWQLALLMLVLAFILGGICALFLLCSGRGRRAKLPFGPCLAFGAVLAFFYGEKILRWYFSL